MANNRSANRSHSHRRLHYSPRINSLKRRWQFSSLWSVVSFNSRLSASTPLITIFTPRVASGSVLQKSLHGGERGPAAFQSPWKLKCQKQECFVRSERSTSEVKRPNNKRKKHLPYLMFCELRGSCQRKSAAFCVQCLNLCCWEASVMKLQSHLQNQVFVLHDSQLK